MISWWSVNGCYFSGLFILLCFPVAFVLLRKKGHLTALSDNWMVFIWTFMTVAVFVGTLFFVFQDYGIQEKVDRRANKQVAEVIKDIQDKYDKLVAAQKELFKKKEKLLSKEVELLKAENATYKRIIENYINKISRKKSRR
ncbi:hypothetical protein KAW55_05765 [bacterium]|nr:hypothetical protein [bacterium]